MGLRLGPKVGNIQRLVSDAQDIVDVRDAGGFWTAAPGTGTIDHIAFRAADRPKVEAVHAALLTEDAGEMNMHDRHYFYSLYVREPSGTLIELASDGPGFLADEPLETLGSELFIPAHFKEDHDVLRVMLPQFGLPGEERITYRDLDFVHRIHMPDNWDGSTLVLLHGSGGSEADLLPLGRKVAPDAMLIGVRGRSTEEGVARFFRRYSMMTFDQKDIVSEAEAFAAFVEDIGPAYGADPERTVFIGNSNGANMLGAVMQLQPRAVRNAVLLRPMNVLEDRPAVELAGTKVLSVSGSQDLYASYAAELEKRLSTAQADVTSRQIEAGHALESADEEIIRNWLSDNGF